MREGEMKLKREREETKEESRRIILAKSKKSNTKFTEVMLTILTNNPFRDPSVDRLMSILKGKLNIGEN